MRATIAVLLCAALAPAQSPQRPLAGFLPDAAQREFELEAKFDRALNRQNFQQWMKRMAAKPHHVGSPASKETAEFIAAQFKSWGYETRIETFYPLFPTPKLRLLESGQKVDYRKIAVEQLAEEMPESFDAVTCLEMLEHVPNPSSVITACARLVKPGGQVFLSTLNRNPKSYLFAVIGAEYVLKMLPKGTHDYAKFIKPSELARWCKMANLEPDEVIGMSYNPLTLQYSLGRDTSVNYLLRATRV